MITKLHIGVLVSICTMKSKIIAIFALIAILGFLGTNSAVYAHRQNYNSNNGDNYNNNGNDYNYSPTYNHYGPYAHFPWNHHRHHFVDPQLDTMPTHDVAISAPTAIDNSGDVKGTTDTATKQSCGDNSICTVNNISVQGNGNTVGLNDNQAGQQDSGAPY